MPADAGLSRSVRKQVANFKAEACRRGITNDKELQAYVNSLDSERQRRIAGLVPLVFARSTVRPS